MHENKEVMGDVKTLNEFMSTVGKLTLDDRKRIVEQAVVLLEQIYVHLPLKTAMHAVDPVRRLRILRRHLDGPASEKMSNELDFHKEMLDIFTSLRDLHTNYMLPEPFSDYIAILPFMVGSYVQDNENRIIVTHVFDDKIEALVPASLLDVPTTFKPGVEIIYWNGIPMQRAVEINANINAGSNLAARLARGIDRMTIRPMKLSLPPDEEWVVIGYRTEDGQDLEYRQKWLMVSGDAAKIVRNIKSEYRYKYGLDLSTYLVTRMKQLLIAPKEVVDSGRRLAKAESIDRVIEEAEGFESAFPLVFRAEKISEDVGLIRIYKFLEDSVANIQIDQLVDEFRKLIMKLPKKGLIIDVRGNGGGWIEFGERLLQFLTPKEITPEPYQLIASPLTLEMTLSTSDSELKPWNSSLLEAVTTGSIFSQGLPLTNTDEANDRGQIYHGPVILVTDALCYSTTDLFAASFQDHQIGPVLGVDTNTGAGGANVVNYGDIQQILVGTKHKLEDLPSGSDMRVSLRRNVRVGEHAGTPVEDLGVTPDIMYSMTRRDLLERNVDLYKKASEILADMPVRRLDALLSSKAGSLEINLVTLGISRIDIYVDDRPVLSQDVGDGTSKLVVDKLGTSAKLVEIIGLKGNEIVAARKQFL